MFWGLILKANKKYTQTLEKPFNLTCAALDHSTADSEPVQVMYSDGTATYLLCTLQKGKDLQCPLNLNFNEGDKLCFSTKGNGIVHLSGFLIPEEDFNYDPMMDDEESEEVSDEEIPDLREKLLKKKNDKQKPGKEQKKKAPVEEESESDENEVQNGDKSLDSSGIADSDDDDEDESLDEEEAEGDDSDEDLEDEEESDEEEEDEESDEEEVQAPPKKQAKLDPQAGKKQKNGLENGQPQKKDKKEKQKEKEQPKKENKPQQNDNAVKKLQGGLLIQDLKVGTGAEAKPGKKIQVYYEGRLKSNNKVFDSTKSGPGFKMTLGRGEVIKGWDIGLAGMKVGGKRRLTCPPPLAYGAKGNPPVIPANSTLVFDVELKNVL